MALVLGCLLDSLAFAAVPVPTEAQLRYQQYEISALIHFGMETFACEKSVGYYGCRKCWNATCPQVPGLGKNPASFAPARLDTDNWVRKPDYNDIFCVEYSAMSVWSICQALPMYVSGTINGCAWRQKRRADRQTRSEILSDITMTMTP